MTKKSSRKNQFLVTDKNRFSQLTEFLNKVSDLAKTTNIDHYFRTGEISGKKQIMDLGAYFLSIAMGFEHDEFIPCVTSPDFPDYVPQSEDYYPWVLFLTESKENDLDEVYHQRAINYLHSDSAGRKNYAIITNFKEISVYDLKHEVDNYSFSIVDLHDAINNGSKEKHAIKALKSWETFLSDFGPESSQEKKKQRRADVVKYIEPKDDRLGFVKRFGHMPDFQKPIGWDGKDFRETFKTKELPFLTTEECNWDGTTKHLENRIIWGDNLSVMRSLPSESIDLIYLDPPFFSGRNYNCIFGDDDEVRTFNDIWDGGLPTYLAWMNARLWEMKRLLKSKGAIYLHLDHHAVHYMKVEMDKIFGPENFRNEIIWYYSNGGGRSKKWFNRKHDTILFYSKSENYKFNWQDAGEERNQDVGTFGGYFKEDKNGRRYQEVRTNGKIYKYYCDEKKNSDDVWNIGIISQRDKSERIGYPTQKPEKLIEKIIRASSDPGDVVGDFFSGGGTTSITAEKLNRKWIACDVSKIAVSVARDRMLSCYSKEAGIASIRSKPGTGFLIQNHGAYDKSIVRQLTGAAYINFILQCYEATPQKKGDFIHGFKIDKAVQVGPSKGKVSVDLIEEFHVELSQKKIDSGIILAWSWDKQAEEYIDELRNGHHGPEIQLVQVKLVDINSHEFKGDNIRFLNKPAAVIRYKHHKGLSFLFDGTASQGRNNTDIHYYQWDFNHKSRFNPMTKPNFVKDSDGDGNPLNDNRKVEYEFPADGKFKVALRIVDKAGAEDTHIVEIDTNDAKNMKVA